MISKLPSHLMISRHGIFYLRITHGGKEKRKSLKTRDPQQAKLAAFKLGYKMSLMTKQDQKIRFATLEEINEEEDFQAAIRQHNAKEKAWSRIQALQDKKVEDAAFIHYLEQNPQLKELSEQQSTTNQTTVQTLESPKLQSITIEEAIEKYKSARRRDTKIGTQRTWSSCYNKLKKTFSGREIRSIQHEEMTEIIVNPIGGKSPETVSKDVDVWFSLFEWLKNHKLIEHNPVIKPSFKSVATKLLRDEFSKPRLIFTDDDIKVLFSKEHLNSLDRPEDPWVQLLGLTTGARLESIARIKIQDITEDTIELVSQYDKQGIQRIIPMHPLLKQAGFLTYVSEMKSEFGKESYLFTEMNEIEGRRSHGFSQRFGRKAKKLGLEKGKVFHSFRATIISALDKANANGQARRLYVGHKVKEKLDVEEMKYLKSKYTTDELAKAIFPHMLWQLDGWTYSPNSSIKQIKMLKSLGSTQQKVTMGELATKIKPSSTARQKKIKENRLEKQRIYLESKKNK